MAAFERGPQTRTDGRAREAVDFVIAEQRGDPGAEEAFKFEKLVESMEREDEVGAGRVHGSGDDGDGGGGRVSGIVDGRADGNVADDALEDAAEEGEAEAVVPGVVAGEPG